MSRETLKQSEAAGAAEERLAGSVQSVDETSFPPLSASPIPGSELGPSDADRQQLSDRLSLVQQRFSGKILQAFLST